MELAEITSALLDSPFIQDADVNAYTTSIGESQLVAYLVPVDDSESLVEELLKALRENLPSYMIPTHVAQYYKLLKKGS